MRRRFKPSTDEPFGIQTGGKRGHSDQTSDITKTKKVRFAEAKMGGQPQHDSPRRHEASYSPRSKSPKTSEYAYFRNLRNRTMDGHSSAVHKENELSKSAKTNSSIGETNGTPGKLKKGTKYSRLLASEERAGDPNHYVFLSPSAKKYNEPDQLRDEDQVNNAKQTFLSLSENVTPVQEHSPTLPLNEEFEISGQQCSEKGVFSSKRQRLRQWVSQASFSEAQKLRPNGSDLVASLLARLFPYGDKLHGSSAGHDDNYDSISKSPPIHVSNSLEKEHQLPPISERDEDLPKKYSCNSKEIALQEQWHTLVPLRHSPNRGRKSHFPDVMMDINLRLLSGESRNNCTKHDLSLCLPRERYESSGTSCHIEELDEFSFPIQHTRKEEPRRLLLEWDLRSDKDRVYLPITEHDNEENIGPRRPSSWKVDNHIFDAKAWCLSSVEPNVNTEFDSLPPYQSTSYLDRDSGPYLKYEVAEQFFPASHCTQKHFDLEDDQNALHSSHFIVPYQDQFQFNDQIWDSKRHNDFLFQYATEFGKEDSASLFRQKETDLYSLGRVEEAPGEPGTSLSKGAFSNLYLPGNFQPSLDGLEYQPFSHYDTSKYTLAEDDEYEFSYS